MNCTSFQSDDSDSSFQSDDSDSSGTLSCNLPPIWPYMGERKDLWSQKSRIEEMSEEMKDIKKGKMEYLNYIAKGVFGACFSVRVILPEGKERHVVVKHYFEGRGKKAKGKVLVGNDIVNFGYHKNLTYTLFHDFEEDKELKDIEKRSEHLFELMKKDGVDMESGLLILSKFGRGMVIMEPCQYTLSHYVERRGRLNVTEFTGIMLGILEGGVFLHQKEICHRDIHSSNIFIDTVPGNEGENGRIRIGDFGAALNFKKRKTPDTKPFLIFQSDSDFFELMKDKEEISKMDSNYITSSRLYKGGPSSIPREIKEFDVHSDKCLDYSKSDIYSIGVIGNWLLGKTQAKNESEKDTLSYLKKTLEEISHENILHRKGFEHGLEGFQKAVRSTRMHSFGKNKQKDIQTGGILKVEPDQGELGKCTPVFLYLDVPDVVLANRYKRKNISRYVEVYFGREKALLWGMSDRKRVDQRFSDFFPPKMKYVAHVLSPRGEREGEVDVFFVENHGNVHFVKKNGYRYTSPREESKESETEKISSQNADSSNQPTLHELENQKNNEEVEGESSGEEFSKHDDETMRKTVQEEYAFGGTLLHYAVGWGDLELVKRIMQFAECGPCKPDFFGIDPLFLALSLQENEIFSYMIRELGVSDNGILPIDPKFEIDQETFKGDFGEEEEEEEEEVREEEEIFDNNQEKTITKQDVLKNAVGSSDLEVVDQVSKYSIFFAWLFRRERPFFPSGFVTLIMFCTITELVVRFEIITSVIGALCDVGLLTPLTSNVIHYYILFLFEKFMRRSVLDSVTTKMSRSLVVSYVFKVFRDFYTTLLLNYFGIPIHHLIFLMINEITFFVCLHLRNQAIVNSDIITLYSFMAKITVYFAFTPNKSVYVLNRLLVMVYMKEIVDHYVYQLKCVFVSLVSEEELIVITCIQQPLKNPYKKKPTEKKSEEEEEKEDEEEENHNGDEMKHSEEVKRPRNLLYICFRGKAYTVFNLMKAVPHSKFYDDELISYQSDFRLEISNCIFVPWLNFGIVGTSSLSAGEFWKEFEMVKDSKNPHYAYQGNCLGFFLTIAQKITRTKLVSLEKLMTSTMRIYIIVYFFCFLRKKFPEIGNFF